MKFKVAILLTVLAAALAAQPVLSITGPNANVRAGSTVPLTVSLSGSTGTNIAALQFSIANPGGTITCAAGSAAVAAGKTATCTSTATNLILLVYGMNANVIADGPVAQLQLTLPISAPGGSEPEALSGLVAATAAGDSASITAASPFVLSTVSLCDITADGKVDTQDALAMVAYIMTGAGSAPDLNGDGKVDMVDLQRLVNASLGQGCRVGP